MQDTEWTEMAAGNHQPNCSGSHRELRPGEGEGKRKKGEWVGEKGAVGESERGWRGCGERKSVPSDSGDILQASSGSFWD